MPAWSESVETVTGRGGVASDAIRKAGLCNSVFLCTGGGPVDTSKSKDLYVGRAGHQSVRRLHGLSELQAGGRQRPQSRDLWLNGRG